MAVLFEIAAVGVVVMEADDCTGESPGSSPGITGEPPFSGGMVFPLSPTAGPVDPASVLSTFPTDIMDAMLDLVLPVDDGLSVIVSHRRCDL